MIVRYLRYKIDTYVERLPIVAVRIVCNRKSQTVMALLDSGADISIFNTEIAGLLDIDPAAGKPYSLRGLVGDSCFASVHQVSLRIENLPSIDTIAAFSQTEDPELAILGQRGVLDNFQIRFRRFNDEIEIFPKSGSA
jgi:hypothetical protein